MSTYDSVTRSMFSGIFSTEAAETRISENNLPFELIIHFNVHYRSLSEASYTQYYPNFWEKSQSCSSLDTPELEDAVLGMLSVPVDTDLYLEYGADICCGVRSAWEEGTGKQQCMRVGADITLWVDEIDEDEFEMQDPTDEEMEYFGVVQAMSLETARSRRAAVVVDVDAVLEERECSGKKDAEAESCTVCLEEFEKGERVARLRCDHCFHKDCIVPWLTQESNTCPLCRHSVL